MALETLVWVFVQICLMSCPPSPAGQCFDKCLWPCEYLKYLLLNLKCSGKSHIFNPKSRCWAFSEICSSLCLCVAACVHVVSLVCAFKCFVNIQNVSCAADCVHVSVSRIWDVVCIKMFFFAVCLQLVVCMWVFLAGLCACMISLCSLKCFVCSWFCACEGSLPLKCSIQIVFTVFLFSWLCAC